MSGGEFDDLIPQSAATSGGGGEFDDLIPAASKQSEPPIPKGQENWTPGQRQIAGYAKTISNIPASATMMIAGAPADISNWAIRSARRVMEAGTGYQAPAWLKGHDVLPLGSADLQRVSLAAGGVGPEHANEFYGAYDPNSRGQQFVSAAGNAVAGGPKGISGAILGYGLDKAGVDEDLAMGLNMGAHAAAAPLARAAGRGALLDSGSEERMNRSEDVTGKPGTLGTIGNGLSRGIESVLAKVPGSVETIHDYVRDSIDNTRARLSGILDNISPTRSPAVAGQAASEGAQSAADALAQQRKALYDMATQRVADANDVNMTPYLVSLHARSTPTPGTENSSRSTSNATNTWLEGRLDGARRDILEYAVKRSGIQPIDPNAPVPLSNQPGPPKLGEDPDLIAHTTLRPDGTPQTVHYVREDFEKAKALAAQSPVLPAPAAMELHRQTGQELTGTSLMSSGMDAGKIKDVWGASRAGLDAALDGTPGHAAMSIADTFFKQEQQVAGLLDPLVKQAGGYESVFNQTLGYAKNTSTLQNGRSVFSTIAMAADDAGRKSLVAGLLDHMGKVTTEGDRPITDSQWTPVNFAKNYENLSMDSKAVIAHTMGSQYAGDMQQLSQWIADVNKNKLYANPSQTSTGLAHIGAVTGAVGAVGHLALGLTTGAAAGAAVGTVAGGMAAAYGAAKLWTNPDFVHWLVRAKEMPMGQLNVAAAQLNAIGQQKGKPELSEFAQFLMQQQQTNPQRLQAGGVGQQ